MDDPEKSDMSHGALKCSRTERSDMPDTLTMVRLGGMRILFARNVFTPWIPNTQLRNDRGQRLVPYAGEFDSPEGAA